MNTSLIENTNGYLIEIGIDYINHSEINNKRIIQSIDRNCPNLKYLKIMVRNSNILELEKLLIKCKYLNVLYLLIYITPNTNNTNSTIDWDNLFEMLASLNLNLVLLYLN